MKLTLLFEVCGIVVVLCRQCEGVEIALHAKQQEDGGYFFEAVWGERDALIICRVSQETLCGCGRA